MRRLFPFLIFVLITGALVAFIYKDKLFPQPEEGSGQQNAQGGGGRRSGGGGGAGGGGGRRGNQIVPVLVDTVKTDNVPVYLGGVGTVQAYNTATVRAQVSGRLTEVNFKEGQEVKPGDILAKIDPVLYQAQYDQAVAKKAQDEATLANARLDEKRYANLVKAENVSQQQADTARATVAQNEALVKQDQAAIDNALANLNYSTIRAPIPGRTGIRLIDMGNLVTSSDATGIVVVAQLRPIAVVFTLPEDTVAEVLEAQSKGPVPVQAITDGNVIGEGKLLVVDNQIDQTTGTVKLKATFENEKNNLWPGLFVNAKLKLKTLENAIVVPSVAVQQGANGSYVYLVTPDNTAKLTNVKVVQEGENRAVIAEGVKPGDTIVTTGFASLQDGSKIRVDTNAGGPAAPGPSSDGQDKQHKRRSQKEADVGVAPQASQPGQEAAASPSTPANRPGTGRKQ